MDPQLKFTLVMSAILFVIALLIPFTREILAGLMTSMVIPALSTLLTWSSLWLMWAMKRMMEAHMGLLSNLLKPHSVIYPTLAKDDDDSPTTAS